MNKIYKVVWSKVKNCYIVVSEIAKNVISGSVKSAKIGAAPVVKGLALGSLMAFMITGNAWAAGNYQYADYQSQTVSLSGNLNVVGTGNNAYGIDAENSTITLGGNGAVVKFDLTATSNSGEAVAIWGNNGSTIDVIADKFEIKTSGSETGSLQANGGTQITVVANEADISGVIWAAGEGSIVNLMQAGNLSISDPNGYPVVQVDDKGIIVVGGHDKTTVVTGDIYATNGGAVGMVLGSSDSTFTGSIKSDGTGGAVLDLQDGATWYVTDDSTIGSIDGNTFNVIAADGAKDVKVTLECDKYDLEIDGEYDSCTGNIQGVDFTINEDHDDGITDGVTIISDSDFNVNVAAEHGIAINNGGKASVVAENITIDSFKAAIWMDKNGDAENKGEVYVNAEGNVSLTSKDRFAINNESQNNGIVTVVGNNVTIVSESMPAIKVGERVDSKDYNGIVNVTGNTITIDGSSHEIVAGWEQRASAVYVEGGTINLSASDTITITDTAKVGGNAIGAYNSGVVNIEDAANLIVDGTVYADGVGSEVNFSGVKQITAVGEVTANNGGSVNVTLETKDSSFTGTTKAGDNGGEVVMVLGDGATWNVDGNSTITNLSGTGGNIINTTGEVITLNVVNYGDNDQHDGEGRFSGAALTNENLIINGVNLVVDTWETAIYNNNVKVDSDSDITIKSAHDDGICAFGEVELDARNVTIEAFDNGIKTSGHYDSGEDAQNGQNRLGYSNVTINADNNVTIKSTEYGEGYALTNNGGNINIVAGNNVELVSHDRPAVRAAYGITESNINVTGKNITVAGKAREHEDSEFKPSVIYAQGIGVLNFSATDNISISDTAKIGGNAVGAYDGGVVNIKNATNVVLDGKVYANGEDAVVNFDNVENITITSIQGYAVSNSSSGATINIGDEQTKTISITGAKGSSYEVFDQQGNFVGYNEENRAVVFSQGTVNITATEKVEITDTNDDTTILAKGGANIIIDGGKQTVVNGEIIADGNGRAKQDDGDIEHQDNGIADDINILIKGKEIILDAEPEAEEGIKARGDASGGDNAVITIGDENTEKVIIKNVDAGLYVQNAGSNIEVNSDTLIIGTDTNYEGYSFGILALNETTVNNKLASVDVNASKTEITVEDGPVSYGVYADGKSSVNVTGDVDVVASGTSAYGVMASNNAIVELGDVNSTVALHADVDGAFAYGVHAYGKSSVNVAGDVDIIASGTSAFGVDSENNASVELGDADSNITFNVSADEMDYAGESRAEAIHAHHDSIVKVDGNMNATVSGRDWVSGVESTRGSTVELGNVTLNVSTKGNDFSEASGINVARKGTVNVNGNLVATIIGGEWATGVEAYNGSVIELGTADSGSNVNINVTAYSQNYGDFDYVTGAYGVFAHGQTVPADDEEAYGASNININADQLTINATYDNGMAYGMYAQDDSTVNANGNIDITATGYSAHGLEVRENSTIQLGAIGKDVSITANSTGEDGEAIAIYAGENSNVNIVADNVNIDTKKIYDGGSLQAKRGSTIYVNANNASVHGIVRATKNAVVNLADANNLKLTSDYLEEYGITPVLQADVGGKVIVGNATGKTEIIGDIFAHDGGQIDVTLNSTSSVFEGSASTRLPDSVPGADESTEGTVNLSLLNGAVWNSYDDSYITTLTLANGVVNMFGSGQTISVDSLKGANDAGAVGTVLVTDFTNRFDVNKADEGTELQVAYDGTYETIVDKKSLILESNKKLDGIVTGAGASNIKVNKNVEIQNSSVLGNYNLDANGDLVVKIDADNLLVGGNVQATTFNGINLSEALDGKANKATTLAGYGITDAYTKDEVNAKLEGITNVSVPDMNLDELKNKTQNISNLTTANKTVITGNVEVSGNVNAKTFNGIDLSTLSTKSEVSNAISKKADKNYVDDELKDIVSAYQASDKSIETKVTNAYKAADTALETKVAKAYKSEDAILSSRITENERSITALENSISKIGTSGDNAYKAADKTLETKVTKAYQDADKALETKVTKAYQAADKALESKVTKEYQAADKALESKLTKDYKAEDAALEIRLSDEYKLADTVVETKLTDAYQAADAALELKVTNAYQAADAKLSSRIEATENSIGALSSNIVGMEDGYKYLDTELEAKITDAYQTADVALEDKVTKAYESADKALESKVTKAYQSADKALESKVTKAYQSADKALESKVTKAYQSADKALETKVTKAYQSADKALETKVTKAYQAADKALENQIKNMQAEDKALESRVTKAYMAADAALQSEVTKAYQAADKALEVEFTGLINGKADKATTLKGYGITDAYTKTEVEKMLKYTGDDEDIEELKNKTQNISEYTTEGITIVNGSIQVFGNVTAQYGNFFTGATFANDAVRIESNGVVRIGGSGNDANVVIYNEGTTSIDAAGSVVGGALVSKGNVEASGNIISTNGDIMAGDISLRETAEAISNKADKATTLEGYGITDAYTKAEIDSKFETKVDASDVYTKSDVDSKLADVSSELSSKADAAYVDSNFAKVDDVYTKEEADATFVKRTEVITVDENGNLVAGTKTEIGENFVVENTSNGSTVTINEGQKGQVVIGDDGKVIFGQHSAWYEDGVGFFVGRTELTRGHDKDNANAAIMDDGRLMAAGGNFTVDTDGSMSAAGGNFTVDADGNVEAKTYNGIELDEFVQNSQEEISGLHQRLGKLSGKVNKVGAGAAALAALHPLEYDPDDKLTFSAGVGNYSGTNAAAIGAFYRPYEKVMVSLGGTMGNDENMANLGISIGLAGTKGYPKLSKKELLQVMSNMVTKNNAVRLENQTIKADNEAIKAENENIKAEVAELKALVAELLAKK